MTRVFSETFKRQFGAILMKKNLFWEVNREEKDTLVVDSAMTWFEVGKLK